MTGISGGNSEHHARTEHGCTEPARAESASVEPTCTRRAYSEAESRVLDAVAACAARWGIDKTTVDDVAREAGVSRATVYRLFPGGKSTMVDMTTDREVTALLLGLSRCTEEAVDLVDALVTLLATGSSMLAEQPAVTYMRIHEPTTLKRFFSFGHFDRILQLSARVLSPRLERFVEPATAQDLVRWLTRLAVSYFLIPDPSRDLTDPAVARSLVESHILPGLRRVPAEAGAA